MSVDTKPVKDGFDEVALSGLINHVKEKPEAGKTVWKAQTTWLGGFKSQAQIRDFTVAMDEPTALGGSNTAPNMVEMVLGAYGCCLTTGYAANAAMLESPPTKGINLATSASSCLWPSGPTIKPSPPPTTWSPVTPPPPPAT